MTKWVQIKNGVVDTVWLTQPTVSEGFVEVADTVEVFAGWTANDNGTFTNPSPPENQPEILQTGASQITLSGG